MRSFAMMENMGMVVMTFSWKPLGLLQFWKQTWFEMNAWKPDQQSSSFASESSVFESERRPAQEAENSLQHTMCSDV